MPAAPFRQSLGIGEPQQPPHRREAAELTQRHESSAARLQIRVNELLDSVVLPRMTHTRLRAAQPVSVVGGRAVLVLLVVVAAAAMMWVGGTGLKRAALEK